MNENIIVDNTGFIEIFNKYDPNFIMKEIRNSLYPQLINDNYFKCFGYKFNIKSTIFAEAISQELIEGWNDILHSEQSN